MWLFLDMNAFFAACEQQDCPDLRGRPVGVVPMLADTTCCIAASYEAKLTGIKTGTSVLEARRLCPNITIVAARPRLYREVHYKIIAAVDQVVPIHEVLSVDEMTVKPWRNEAALVDALRLGQRVQDVIRQDVGEWLSCSIGLAPNAFLAKVASDFQKPRGLSVISFDDIPHKLTHMALTDWPGIAKRTERRFNAAGVYTTEEMYALTMAQMKAIFGGVHGERWWRLIRGENVALPVVKRSQIGHSNVLAPEYRTKDGAWSVACRLLEKSAERLRAEGSHARRLCVGVSGYSGESWTDAVKFAPLDRTHVLLKILKGLWRECIARPSHVSIALQEIIKNEDVTLPLFGAGDESLEVRLDAAVDRLNRRFGRGTVTAGSALATKGYLEHGRIPFGKPTELR